MTLCHLNKSHESRLEQHQQQHQQQQTPQRTSRIKKIRKIPSAFLKCALLF